MSVNESLQHVAQNGEKRIFDLDTPLLHFRDDSGCTEWNYRQAMEGCLVLGNTGAGKSSSSSFLIAEHFLKNDFGGLVLTAKQSEVSDWKAYCRDAGRLDDLIIVRPGGDFVFDFLKHITQGPLNVSTYSQNVVKCLETVIEAAQNKSGGRNSDDYWINAMHELLTNAVNLCLLAYGTISVEDLYEIVTSAPKKSSVPMEKNFDGFFKTTFEEAQRNIDRDVLFYIDNLSIEKKERFKDPKYYTREIQKRFPAVRTFRLLDKFFFETYRTLAEKTRSIVESSVTGFLFRLLQEPVFSLFCNEEMNFSPEDCLEGKIILLDLPVTIYEKAGQDCQTLFKYCFQKAMEKRNIETNERPIFIFADECHNFIAPGDQTFQAICRSSRIATVYISQNLGNFHSAMPGEKSEHLVKSLLSTLSTKIFHCNSDVETNNWASDIIGEAYTEEHSVSDTFVGEISMNNSKAFRLQKMVRPEAFGRLKTGGPKHQFMAEAYVYLQGTQFHDGFNHRKIVFRQKPNNKN